MILRFSLNIRYKIYSNFENIHGFKYGYFKDISKVMNQVFFPILYIFGHAFDKVY
jgi:hypothetical protein